MAGYGLVVLFLILVPILKPYTKAKTMPEPIYIYCFSAKNNIKEGFVLLQMQINVAIYEYINNVFYQNPDKKK